MQIKSFTSYKDVQPNPQCLFLIRTYNLLNVMNIRDCSSENTSLTPRKQSIAVGIDTRTKVTGFRCQVVINGQYSAG